MADKVKKEPRLYHPGQKDWEKMQKMWADEKRRGKGDARYSGEMGERAFHADMLRKGNVPGFYYMGGGDFGKETGGYMPAEVDLEYVPYFEGDLWGVAVPKDTLGVQPHVFFAPLNNEFNELYQKAIRAHTIEGMSRRFSKAGGSYGLKPHKRKRSSPFTIDAESLANFKGSASKPHDGDE